MIGASVADFKRDVWGKQHPWVRVTHRFVYVVPVGPGGTAPYGCGMWWVHEDGSVQIAAQAKVNKTPETLPQQVIQALAYRAAQDEGLTPI